MAAQPWYVCCVIMRYWPSRQPSGRVQTLSRALSQTLLGAMMHPKKRFFVPQRSRRRAVTVVAPANSAACSNGFAYQAEHHLLTLPLCEMAVLRSGRSPPASGLLRRGCCLCILLAGCSSPSELEAKSKSQEAFWLLPTLLVACQPACAVRLTCHAANISSECSRR